MYMGNIFCCENNYQINTLLNDKEEIINETDAIEKNEEINEEKNEEKNEQNNDIRKIMNLYLPKLNIETDCESNE